MRGQSAIERHEAQVLDQALSEEEAIEWVARCRQRFEIGENVGSFDGQEFETRALDQIRQMLERAFERKLADPSLDGDLPQAHDAGVEASV